MSSKQTHSPGPWSVGSVWGNGVTRFVNGPDQVRPGEFDIVAEARGHNVDERDANAKLIASAPDLLEACLKIITWDEQDLPDDDNLDAFDWEANRLTEAVEAVRAAILKATGGGE